MKNKIDKVLTLSNDYKNDLGSISRQHVINNFSKKKCLKAILVFIKYCFVKKILVIKHGSLGDIIFALPSMISIRKEFPDALVYLLTEEKYVSLLMKPKILIKSLSIIEKIFFLIIFNVFKLLKMEYDTVIDLQNSKRTSIYNLVFRLFSKSLVCSSRPFAHLRYKIPSQGKEAVRIGLSNQLNLLNIITDENPNYNWLKVDVKDEITQPMFLLFREYQKTVNTNNGIQKDLQTLHSTVNQKNSQFALRVQNKTYQARKQY